MYFSFRGPGVVLLLRMTHTASSQALRRSEAKLSVPAGIRPKILHYASSKFWIVFCDTTAVFQWLLLTPSHEHPSCSTPPPFSQHGDTSAKILVTAVQVVWTWAAVSPLPPSARGWKSILLLFVCHWILSCKLSCRTLISWVPSTHITIKWETEPTRTYELVWVSGGCRFVLSLKSNNSSTMFSEFARRLAL